MIELKRIYDMMKKIVFAIVTLFGLLPLQTAQAQGVLYISDLGQPVAGSAAIGSNSWIAQTFVTGTNAGGYVLNSVQLLMDAPMGTPSGFNVSIYSKTGSSPQARIGMLTGPDPTMAGVFSYTNPGIFLTPSSFYYVVVTAATSTNNSSYTWSATTGFFQTNRFTIDDGYFSSTNGSNWTSVIRQKTFQLALYLSAAPPPNLSIVSAGPGNIKIQWPNVGSYCLEQNTNLAGNTWTASDLTISNNAPTNFCIVTPTHENLFFRLGQQSGP